VLYTGVYPTGTTMQLMGADQRWSNTSHGRLRLAACRWHHHLSQTSTANACAFHDRLADSAGFAQCVEQVQVRQKHKIVWYLAGVV
jgi:hypothetical protein